MRNNRHDRLLTPARSLRRVFAPTLLLAVLLAIPGSNIARGLVAAPNGSQESVPPPLRQSTLTVDAAGPRQLLSLRDAARDDRWLGLGVSDVRWAPDGSAVYFRWNADPYPTDDPAADPWYRVVRDGSGVTIVAADEVGAIPPANVSWSRDGTRAAWTQAGTVWLYDAGAPGAPGGRAVLTLARRHAPRP